jgi:hypothetical protein
MSKIKKPIEIIRHPIEMHGKICSTARTKDDGAIKQEQWKNQYRLEHPIYNLNHGGPSFVAGIVSAFLGSLLIAVFSMNQSFVSRYALVCFAVGYGVDWLAKKEFHKAFEKQFSMGEKK